MHQQSKGRICSAIYLGVFVTGVGWGVCDCSSTEGLDNNYIALLEHVVKNLCLVVLLKLLLFS